MYKLSHSDILQLIRAAGDAGATRSRIESGNEPAYVGLREAWRTFGRPNVTRWLSKGLIPHAKHIHADSETSNKFNNNKLRIPVTILKELSLTDNLMSTLSAAEKD